jgi:PAS domain S-box-containing protein
VNAERRPHTSCPLSCPPAVSCHPCNYRRSALPALPSRSHLHTALCYVGWHDVTGYRFTEVANNTSRFLQGPDTETTEERQLVRACNGGKHARVRLLNYNKAGDPFFNTLECFPLRDARGEVSHFCGVLRSEPADLSRFARRMSPPVLDHPPRSEAGGGSSGDESAISRRSTVDAPCAPAARHRPKRARGESVSIADALNNTTDAVVMTQPFPPYAITHVNAPWCEMCGYTLEEVQGGPNSILHGPETDQAILDDLMASVGRGEPTSATLVNYKKGGQRFVNQVQVTPLYNEEDELEHFMAMLHDVDSV